MRRGRAKKQEAPPVEKPKNNVAASLAFPGVLLLFLIVSIWKLVQGRGKGGKKASGQHPVPYYKTTSTWLSRPEPRGPTNMERCFQWLSKSPKIGSPCYKALHNNFLGAFPSFALFPRIMDALEDEGMNPDNTILGTSLCPDEINNQNNDLPDLLRNVFGKVFPLGGISGAPLVGKTGFGAFSHHVPDNGNIVILFGPHIAIAENGEVGKHLRHGQQDHSTACGAVIGAYHYCLGEDYTDFNKSDLQMSWIKNKMGPHCQRCSQEENPMVAITYQAFEMVKEKIEQIVNTTFSSGKLVLIGGLQINLPDQYEDHFLPLMFEVRQTGVPTKSLLESALSVPRLAEKENLGNEALHVQLFNKYYSRLHWAPEMNTPLADALFTHFRKAMPSPVVFAKAKGVFDDLTFNGNNTIFGTSLCPDEINNQNGDLPDLLSKHFGMCFPLGGISGAPLVGKTGFGAFSHHVPDDGNIVIIFGPHVGISESGEVGKVLRHGQCSHSTACGAVIGAYHACLGDDIDDIEFDTSDLQMSWIKTELSPHCKRCSEDESPMVSLIYQAYEMVKAKMEKIIDTNFSSGKLVLLGGIQINLPDEYEDHFLPLMFDVRQSGEANEDLMHVFDTRTSRLRMNSMASMERSTKNKRHFS